MIKWVHLYIDMVEKQLQKPHFGWKLGLLILPALPFLIYSLPTHIKKLIKKKKQGGELNYTDDEYLVQDWRGFVITQEAHIRIYGFEGYPSTHATNCECQHCRMASWNYAEENGYLRIRRGWPSRRQIFDYLNRQTFDYPWVKKEADFLPKKKMKVHKLDQPIRKETFVRPGVYIREVDYSVVVSNSEYYSGIVRRNR